MTKFHNSEKEKQRRKPKLLPENHLYYEIAEKFRHKKSSPKLVRIVIPWLSKFPFLRTLKYWRHFTTSILFLWNSKIRRLLWYLNQHKLCFKAKRTRPTLFFISNFTKTESL